LILVENQSQTP